MTGPQWLLAGAAAWLAAIAVLAPLVGRWLRHSRRTSTRPPDS